MARDEADIAELKSRIPVQFQPPSSMSGSLSLNFQSQGAMLAPYTLQGSENPSVSEADPFTDDHAREMQGRIFAADPDASPSFMLTGAQASMRASSDGTEQKKRERDTRRQLLDALNRRLAELNADLLRIDTRLEEIRLRKNAIGEELEALDDIEKLAASGQLDPRNPKHAELLRKAGIDPAKVDQHNISDLITQRRRAMNGEDEALDGEATELLKQRKIVELERAEVEAARNDIESANTPEALERAEARARTILGSQQLGEAAYQTESDRANEIAADAVANNERAELQAGSEDYNRLAATEDSGAILSLGDESFELDVPQTKPFTPSPV